VHVLELAEPLSLTPEQRQSVQQLYEAMKEETIAIGAHLISQEAGLDRQFAQHSITPESLAEAIVTIGETQGALRLAHLKYHLATVDMLNADQVRQYAELRGYSSGHSPIHHPKGH
jgi:hypothetical protein